MPHADAVEPEPFAVFDRLFYGCVAQLQPFARAGDHLFFVERSDLLSKELDLLVVGKVQDAFLNVFVFGKPHDALLELFFHILDGKRAAVRPHAGASEFLDRRACRCGGNYAFVLYAHIAKVVLVEYEGFNGGIDAFVRLGRFVTCNAAACQPQRFHEGIPGEYLRVRLAHVGQNVVDVAAEYRVGREKVDVGWRQRLAFGVEQVGDALQEY